jgi:hypothetical protein
VLLVVVIVLSGRKSAQTIRIGYIYSAKIVQKKTAMHLQGAYMKKKNSGIRISHIGSDLTLLLRLQ